MLCFKALAGRIDSEGKLSRNHSKNNLAEMNRNPSSSNFSSQDDGKPKRTHLGDNLANKEKPKFVLSSREFEREE